jgi:UDP-glucuronate 4-epimerase
MSYLVTGAAGFIGFHVTIKLLERGDRVIGVDNLNDYYDVSLKEARLEVLQGHRHFSFAKLDLTDRDRLFELVDSYPELSDVIHLAAQAGVRHSLHNPYTYINANIMGTLVVLEAARRIPRLHGLVYASSSSVYGANTKRPFGVGDRVDHPVSLYAASKRSCELISESYSRLYKLPITGLRLFTVYGPWGRPDMAYYLFTRAILAGEPIKLFNEGRMVRDFTYVDDAVAGILAAIDRPSAPGDHRLYNLGNHRPERLLDFVAILEDLLGRRATKHLIPMQPGDVPGSYADIETARRHLGFEPKVTIKVGLSAFVDWYKRFHRLS